MSIHETPPLLVSGSKSEYMKRMRSEYSGTEINTPEGAQVIFYLDNDINCEHPLCGKKSRSINKFRAHRILWVRYLLENESVRVIKRSISNSNLVFYCSELSYVVVCSILPSGKLKFITQYIISQVDAKKFNNPLEYELYIFNT